MEGDNTQLDRLLQRLNVLAEQQTESYKELQAARLEIIDLRKEIMALKAGDTFVPDVKPKAAPERPIQAVEASVASSESLQEEAKTSQPEPRKLVFNKKKDDTPTDLERLIGENIINKIGILITVLGVGIGAKYSIDNNLISPLTRIVLGYLVGAGLLVFAMRLKPNYEKFSAVLLGGALSVFYFITYFAHSFYDLIPQSLAFGLMAIFTAFTAFAATKYNQISISLLGLIGAYAVPFLLSSDSGNVTFLFSYIFIVNLGIVALAFQRDWKLLSNVAFALTWTIFLAWFEQDYLSETHFNIALGFSSLFFLSFYAIALAFKLGKTEQLSKWNTAYILINALIYYGISYTIFDQNPATEGYLGLMTLGHAVVHFAFASFLFRQKNERKNLFYLGLALTLIFLTIAIPVQLDGNWVTILWAVEAVVLLWIGRKKALPIFEYLAYAALALAFGSLLDDWSKGYDTAYFYEVRVFPQPIFNAYFLSSLAVALALGCFVWFNFMEKSASALQLNLQKLAKPVLAIAFLLVTYAAFNFELATYFDNLFHQSRFTRIQDSTNFDEFNYALTEYKQIWQINYSLFFLSILSIFVLKYVQNPKTRYITIGLNVLSLVSFMFVGTMVLGQLRGYYIHKPLVENYDRGTSLILIRYISLAFFALNLYFTYKLSQNLDSSNPKFSVSKIKDIGLALATLFLVSSELLHWMELSGNENANKLGLSILWGCLALLFIVVGIRQKKKHLRIFAIGLFALTLVKLFAYDIASLDTISKTIVFVSLGLLLLVISFLYNKFGKLEKEG